MAIQKFRVRGGLLADNLIQFNTVSDAGEASGKAVNNFASGADEILVLDATGGIAYRTPTEIASDMNISLTLGRGAGLAFDTGGTLQDEIGFSTDTQNISIELPATLAVGSTTSKGVAGSGSSAGTGHSHLITTSTDTTVGNQSSATKMSILASDLNGDISVNDFGAHHITASGDMIVTGSLTVSGTTTTVSSTNTTLVDPLLVLNKGGKDEVNTIDAGLMMESAEAGANAVFIWSQNDSRFEFFTTPDNDETVTFAESDKTFAETKMSKLTLTEDGVSLFTPGMVNITSSSAASNATTGALRVTGGVGIGGALYTTGNIQATAGVKAAGATDATTTATGSLISSGGLGVALKSFFGKSINATDTGVSIVSTGQVNVASTTAASKNGAGTSPDAGSILTAGGIGVNGHSIFKTGMEILEATTSIKTTGWVNITSTTASSTATTGALIVAGGAGINGNITSGGDIAAGGTLKAAADTDALTGEDAVALASMTGSAIFEGGLSVKKDVAIGNTLSVYNSLTFQDVGLATAGTGTVQQAWMIPFKSAGLATTADPTAVVSLKKTDFTSAEILITGTRTAGAGAYVFTAKALICQDGNSTARLTIYGEVGVGALPVHVWDVGYTASGGGSGTTHCSLLYDHSDTGEVWTISGIAIASR
jgi:hypothetical protein